MSGRLDRARERGAADFRNGVAFEDNPYVLDDSRSAWEQGWADARDEAHKARKQN